LLSINLDPENEFLSCHKILTGSGTNK
jgi:hypothetical protein